MATKHQAPKAKRAPAAPSAPAIGAASKVTGSKAALSISAQRKMLRAWKRGKA